VASGYIGRAPGERENIEERNKRNGRVGEVKNIFQIFQKKTLDKWKRNVIIHLV